jgi:hypothetical protein
VDLNASGVLLYGTAAPGGAERVIELQPYGSADVCYSTTCPSTTLLYPQPNFVLTLGGIVFDPYNIVPGTGISSASTDFSFYGDLTYLANSATFPSVDDKPTLFTGEDESGLTSYLYFENADGTFSNVLHVADGAQGGAFLEGVLVDPPGSVSLDMVGFIDPVGNSFVTTYSPEPGTLPLFAGAGAILMLLGRIQRRRRS